jgi:transcriptional regulator with XRE-family HTH domain
MNYIKQNRTELQLTQCELVSLINYNLTEQNSLYRLSQSRLSFLERLSTNELLTKLNVLEYKQLKTIFNQLYPQTKEIVLFMVMRKKEWIK